MPSKQKSNAVLVPNLGVYLDRPSIALDKRMLEDCRNVRVKNGEIVRDNMGYSPFISRVLPDPVTLVDQFFLSSGSQILIFGTTKDLYQYNEGTADVTFITPIYSIGTADATVSTAIVSGTGTGWTSGIAVGDYIAFGSADTVDPDATWYEIAAVSTDTKLTLVSVIASAVVSSAYTVRKIFNGTVKDYWNTDSYLNATSSADHWYATNGVDDIVRWDGASAQVSVLSALNFKCRDLLVYKEMLLCFNITEAGVNKRTSMKNSDVGTPEDFTNGLAGEFIVYDGSDAIEQALLLGDNVVVYGSRHIALAQFVGSPTIFVFRTSIDGIGIQAGRAVVDFGDFHEFLGPDAQYSFDGISLREIGTQVWREALRAHAPNKFDFFQAHIDEENGEVLWITPLTTDPGDNSTGQPVTAYVEHYLENVPENTETPYTIRDLPATATGYFERATTLRFSDITTAWSSQNFRWNDRFFQASFPLNLFGDEDGNIFKLNETDDANGADITSYATFGLRATVDGRRKGIIKRIYPYASKLPAASYNLTVRVGLSNQANEASTASGDFGYDLTQADDANYFISPFLSGRFYQVEFRVEGQGRSFNLAGYDVEIVRAGKR